MKKKQAKIFNFSVFRPHTTKNILISDRLVCNVYLNLFSGPPLKTKDKNIKTIM